MDGTRCDKQTDVVSGDSRGTVSVHRNLRWTWFKQPYNYPKRNDHRVGNRYYKYISAVIALLVAAPVNAETVGGVSATASPVANSSGSVTNQAIQVLQGPYITNTYGGGIQCQGPTLNITPYITGAVSAQRPYESHYNDPVYDITDNFGAFDEDGNPMGDGILDNPGDVVFYKRTRTGQKDSFNLSVGVSATWSRPQDRKLQELCKEAASSNIALMQQTTANKRLDFEIARLKNCGELLKAGISFKPGTKYARICADVMVQNVNVIAPHRHTIPSPSVSESRVSERAADLDVPSQTQQASSSPE